MLLKRRLTRLPVPEARRMADLAGLSADIGDVRHYCHEIATFPREQMHQRALEALKEAAVVKYGRCFATGVRTAIPRGVFDGAPSSVQIAHDHLIDIRNKYVAHSVNEFEETDVFVLMEKAGYWYEIAEIGTAHVRRTALGPIELRYLEEVSAWVDTQLKAMIETERKLLLSLARSLGRRAVSRFGLIGTGEIALRAKNPKPKRSLR